MFIDISSAQEKKYGQNAFGDYFISRRHAEEGRVLAVLSDGLGSGVKASILARMTATMLLGFIEEDMDIRDAAALIMNSLPVCRVRGLNYATFSIIDCDDEGRVRVVEEGNPDFLWLRGTRQILAPYSFIESSSFPDRRMKLYNFEVLEGDRLIFVSDGVTQAGLGQPGYANCGLGRQGLLDFLKTRLERQYTLDSLRLAIHIRDLALKLSPNQKAVDDISAAVVHFRNPRRCVVFTGPPFEKRRDSYYAQAFNNFKGRKAICGGTTAIFLARELQRDLAVGGDSRGGLPPLSTMDGIDLVTEGLLTLTRAIHYLEIDDFTQADAAGSLVRFLMGHDIIHIMEGTGINLANFDPSRPFDFEIRRTLVKKLADVLQTKHLRSVRIQRV
ncbi:MAG: serine/threonine-protein phosphatase [Deltaproteobacteria bacterium]|jgi:hypothetical protein|nr:serine/threonine-protein phosphatase [Deltaproteobacteria bacterium]